MPQSDVFGAQFREVHEETFNDRPVHAVVGSRVYATDVDDLWNAMTDKERLPRWFSKVEGDFELGGKFQIEGNASGSILECEASKKLVITWEFGGQLSWVRVTLSPEGEQTKMQLEHLIPTDDAAAEEHWKKYGPGATGVGWDLAFHGLGVHTETGEAIDPAKFFEWMATDEGKAACRGSAAAWGEAHVAGGEDRAVAEAMAEATGSFFTGG